MIAEILSEQMNLRSLSGNLHNQTDLTAIIYWGTELFHIKQV